MKKLTIFHVLIAGVVFFALALLDSVMKNARGISDLSYVGKTFALLCAACLAYLVYIGFVLPVFNWVKSKRK